MKMNRVINLVVCLLLGTQLLSAKNEIVISRTLSKPAAGSVLPVLKTRAGLPNFYRKISSGESLSIVYLGGSITECEGYRVHSSEWLKKEFPKNQIKTYSAGIGGTGSDLGVFRLKEDVLKHNPDLVFIEFAVNDGGLDSAVIVNSIEGIIRQIKQTNYSTDICMLYTISEPMLPIMKAGRLFRSMQYMEQVADYYQLPSINFGVEIARLVQNDKILFRGEEGASSEKLIFTYDGTHPTLDQGHKIYNRLLVNSLLEMRRGGLSQKYPTQLPSPYSLGNYEKASVFSPLQLPYTNGWKRMESTNPLFSITNRYCPEMIYTDSEMETLSFRFFGTAFGIYDLIGPSSVGYELSIDGAPFEFEQRFDGYCFYYRMSYRIFRVQEGEHRVTLRYKKQLIDKESIILPHFKKNLTDKIISDFSSYNLYFGKLLLIGELLK